ncbi:MAG: AI-2E family transporter [Bacillota bacterium]
MKYVKPAGYGFVIVALLILFEKIISNVHGIVGGTTSFLKYTVDMTMPFVIGFAIAYLMNPFVKFLEKNIDKRIGIKEEKIKSIRAMCVAFSYLIIFGGFVYITLYLGPEFEASFKAVMDTIAMMSTYDYTAMLTGLFEQFDFIDMEYITNIANAMFSKLMAMFQNVPALFGGLLGNLVLVGGVAVDVIMGLFIAFYLLYDKESFMAYLSKVFYALFEQKKTSRFFVNCSRVNGIFQSFIVGKALDSFIVAIIAFVGFTVLKAPFAIVLALIIGVTNMIPYFGPFIGGIPVVILTILASDLTTGLWVTVFIVVLQQFDGNVIGPKILGDSVDLSPLLIILAVVVGGALAGVVGMFIGVPILATIKMFFTEYVNARYLKKYGTNEPLKNIETKSE